MYKIKLSQFEGPLDLLLFFIKRDELNIYDIPISKITKDFMEYLRMLEQLDLEIAGDFILMAATLMQIKVKMLLPKEIDEKGEEIDPRADLVKALLEYKRYKEMSEELSYMEANMRNYNFRGNFNYDYKEAVTNYETLLKNITIYDLMKAFKKILLQNVEQPVHQIQKWNVTIDEQMVYISNKLKEKSQISFVEILKELRNKIRIIVTFIAMLEMVKSGQIGLRESPSFNDFIIYRLNNG
ncbi:segregation and condensation protein A [Rosettibacter firmus]|uniref:segregation and condensation protein A n=1 Tax=Rosettibacter firmus TaxID=3111522 RepID=UPI00336C0C62